MTKTEDIKNSICCKKCSTEGMTEVDLCEVFTEDELIKNRMVNNLPKIN